MPDHPTPDALVIGGGPAGLMAADQLSAAGFPVLLAEAKPSFGRKLLMAGKSGLNLTRDQPLPDFIATYTEGARHLTPYLEAFGPEEVKAWAIDLGQETFTGTSARVFPRAMKASPLLRVWAARLSARGVTARTNWRWTGWDNNASRFDTPEGPQTITPRATILALGGASWPRLGSDGTWTNILKSNGISIHPFRPSNVGFHAAWSSHMTRHFGAAIKPVRLNAGGQTVQAEFVITARGIEGGGVYALSHILRDGAPLTLDLVPDRDQTTLQNRLSRPRDKASLTTFLRKSLNLPPAKIALLRECCGHNLTGPARIAASLKSLPIPLTGPFPIGEAISTAGGLPWSELDNHLMLHKKPGVFCAGEMLDWDSPTGGYLLTACLATGRAAGRAATAWLKHSQDGS